MKTGYVLITGASEGMGREFSKIFAANGFPLVLIARNEARLTELAKELTAQYGIDVKIISKDLSVPNAASELKDEIAQLSLDVEILVNNAGIGSHGFFHKTDWIKTEAMLNLNMISLTHLTHIFLPEMIKKGHGKILNVASTAAFQPGPLMACYFATKAYVLYLTEAITSEIAGTGVTVSTFCPGPTKTEFQKRSTTEHIRENSIPMDAAQAVKIAYQGLMKGKQLIIPGFFNNLLAVLVKLSPRGIVDRVTRFLMEEAK